MLIYSATQTAQTQAIQACNQIAAPIHRRHHKFPAQVALAGTFLQTPVLCAIGNIQEFQSLLKSSKTDGAVKLNEQIMSHEDVNSHAKYALK